MTEISIVRQNLMDDVNYRPYCGNNIARNTKGGCYNPRSIRQADGQFKCPICGWTSEYPDDFIQRYKTKYGL